MQSKILSMLTRLMVVLTASVLFPVLVFASTNVFTRTVYMGMSGEDVRDLQKFLNTDIETRVANTGAGSAGNETDYFGPATKRALIKFQEKYRTEVLAPIGLKLGTGIFGTKTREKINALLEAKNNSALLVENVSAFPNKEQINFGLPIRLKIPSINVDAAIISVGLTSRGEMGVPKGPADVAWLNIGPRPGNNGSAVIAGHYGRWKNGGGSVFDNLNTLKKGDRLYVEDEKGAIAIFIVRESQNYDPNADASSVFISNDEKSHLNLITCEGVWIPSQKTYSNRLVVFTDKVD